MSRRAAAPGRWSAHDDIPHLPALLRQLRIYRLLQRTIARRVDLLLRCLVFAAPHLVRDAQVPHLVRLACCDWRCHPSLWRGETIGSLSLHLIGAETPPEPASLAVRRAILRVTARVGAVSARVQYGTSFAPAAEWNGGSWRVEGALWVLTQILSKREAIYEGRALRHCVAAYWPQAASGYISLWSLKKMGYRMLTIETHHKTREIVQVRGEGNRKPTPEEAMLVMRWADEQGLAIEQKVLPLIEPTPRSDTRAG